MKKFLLTAAAVAVGILAALGLYGWYQSRQIQIYTAAAYTSQGMVLASQLKNHVAVFYAETGRLPSSNAELGLPAATTLQTESVSAAEVSGAGVITIRYNHTSGRDGGIVRMTPQLNPEPVGIRWTCSTPHFKNIQDWAPQCVYAP